MKEYLSFEVEAGKASKDRVEDDSIIFLTWYFRSMRTVLMSFMPLFFRPVIVSTSFALALLGAFLLDWLKRVAFGVNIVL